MLNDRLNLSASWDYLENNSKADFSAAAVAGAKPTITEYDDYVKETLRLKGDFELGHNLTLTAGYTYERFQYDDIAIDDYLFSYTNGGGSVSYLTGAYADVDYEASLGFVSLAYRF